LSDGGGLYLPVEKNGSKLWRHAFRFDGKQKLDALGAYPIISLADARAGRDANKSPLTKGIDLSVQRKIDRGAARIARSNTSRLSPTNRSKSSSPRVTIRRPSNRLRLAIRYRKHGWV
jgi:hypothetical protein